MTKIKYGSLRWIWLSVVIILLDHFTKTLAVKHLTLGVPVYITSFFNFSLAYNKGAAFSLLSQAGGWQAWLFGGIALVISLVILVWLQRLPPAFL